MLCLFFVIGGRTRCNNLFFTLEGISQHAPHNWTPRNFNKVAAPWIVIGFISHTQHINVFPISLWIPKIARKLPATKVEKWDRFFLRSLKRTNSADTLILDFPDLWENKFLFKPPRLWYSVLSVLTN